MKRPSLGQSLGSQGIRLAMLVMIAGLFAACATQPTDMADAKRAASAERIADRIASRADHSR